MGYLAINYKKIEAQIINSILKSTAALNLSNPTLKVEVVFEGVWELGADFMISNEIGNRRYTLELSGPEAYSIDFKRVSKEGDNMPLDELDQRYLQGIATILARNVANTYLAISESKLSPTVLSRTVQ